MASEIVSARPDDAPRIKALVREAYAKWVPLIGREPLPMQADYDRAVAEHDIDLLLVDGTLAGLIEMIGHSDHLFIENLAIAPAHQGQGHGKRLLTHAESLAHEANLPALRLLTNGAFTANIRLYQSVGYAITHTEPFLGGTTVHMSKSL